MIEKIKRLEQLYYQKQIELNKCLAKNKRDEKRLQIMIGKAMLDKLELLEGSESYDQHKSYITTVLHEFTTNEIQREFLRQQDFILGHKD